jgi:hypothetical protein
MDETLLFETDESRSLGMRVCQCHTTRAPAEFPGGDLTERLMRTPMRLWQALATSTALFE